MHFCFPHSAHTGSLCTYKMFHWQVRLWTTPPLPTSLWPLPFSPISPFSLSLSTPHSHFLYTLSHQRIRNSHSDRSSKKPCSSAFFRTYHTPLCSCMALMIYIGVLHIIPPCLFQMAPLKYTNCTFRQCSDGPCALLSNQFPFAWLSSCHAFCAGLSSS